MVLLSEFQCIILIYIRNNRQIDIKMGTISNNYRNNRYYNLI